MEIKENTWQLASVLLDEHGRQALYDVRGLCETMRKPGSDTPGANCHDIVRAMDLILSYDGHGTLH